MLEDFIGPGPAGPLPPEWIDKTIRIYRREDFTNIDGKLIRANATGVLVAGMGWHSGHETIFIPWAIVATVELLGE